MRPGRETFQALLEVESKEHGPDSIEEWTELTERVASKDPADQAYDLIMKSQSLAHFLATGMKEVDDAFRRAQRDVEGAKRYGGEHIAALELIGGAPLRALKSFRDTVDMAVQSVEDVVKEGKRRPR